MPLAPIQLAARGLTAERDPTRLRTGDLLIAHNLDFSVPGLVQKEGGSAKLNASALAGAPAVLAGTEFWATESVQRRVVAAGDGTLYKDDLSGAYATLLKSGLATNKVTFFAQGGLEATGNARKLFILNGSDVVQVLAGDGVTTSDLALPPADWNAAGKGPAFMFRLMTSAGELMVGGGTPTNQDYLYGSSVTNHEDWTAAGVLGFNVFPGLGRRLVAGLSAFGKAWLWKYPRGIVFLDQSTAAVSGWYAKIAHEKMGAAPTPWAATQITEGPVLFLNQAGQVILMEETAATLSGVRFVNLCDRKNLNLLDVIAQQFNKARLDRCQLHWYEDKSQLHAIYSALGTTVENRRLVLDLNDERMRSEITTKDVNECLWFEQDTEGIQRPRGGDNAGFTWQMDQMARTVDGATYAFVLHTAPTDFSDVDPAYAQKKLFSRLHLEYEPMGNFDVTVDVYIDGRFKGSLAFNMGSGATALPLTLPATLGGAELKRRAKDCGGEGYQIALKCTEAGGNNPRLARAWAEFDLIGMAP